MTGRRRPAHLSLAVAVSLVGSQLVIMAPAAASVPGLDDFRPNGDATTAPTSITVYAYEADVDITENWDITAHAICASTAD